MPTSLQRTQAELRWLRDLVEQRLGGRCAPFQLTWSLRWALQKAAPRPETFGLDDQPALRNWLCGSEGHALLMGLELYRVRTVQRTIPVAHVTYPSVNSRRQPIKSVWFCREADRRRLYRFLRRTAKDEQAAMPPLMADAERQTLWDNTIGFLLKGRDVWERFQVPLRRGVMLIGEPGNGKTMAARRLREQADVHDLEWRVVTGEEYDGARCNGTLGELLALDDHGLIFLDDFDRGLEDRSQARSTMDHSALLSALDGMETRQGVVYVFTSNLQPKDLDPAIRRPGRIDTFIPFPRPTVELRRRFFSEVWPAEIRAAVPLEEAVAATEGLSFAEIDEVKKLMVLDYLEHQTWNWRQAWRQFQQRVQSATPRPPIGFATVPQESKPVAGKTAATKCAAE